MPGTALDTLQEASNVIFTVKIMVPNLHMQQNGQVLGPKPGRLSVIHLGTFDLAVKTQTPLDFPNTPSMTQGP